LTRQVVELALAGRLGIVALTALGALAMAAPLATAAGTVEDVQSTLVSISVMSLPLTGLLVLAIYALPSLLGRPAVAEPTAFHLANIVVVTALLTLLGALLVPFVYVEGVSTTLSFAVIGVLDALLVAGIMARYLLFPPWKAAVAGGLVAVITVSWAYLAFEMDYSSLLSIEDLARLTLPVWLLVYIGLLFLETNHYHTGSEGPTPPGGGRPNRDRRMLRLGESLIMNMVVAGGLWLAWLS
jgi:hypothetical protein